MKKILLLFFFCFTQSGLTAQTFPEARIVLFPYDPIYYMSDAEADINQQSAGKDMKSVRKYFHSNLYDFTYRSLARKFGCYAPMNDTTPQAYQMLVTVFEKVGYTMADPVIPDTNERKKLLARFAFLKVNHQQDNDISPGDLDIAEDYYLPEEKKYLQATFTNNLALQQVSKNTGSDYLIFLNQLEIKTDYKTCIDASNKIYPRFVKVHYTIFNREGKVLAGNIAIAEFKSSTSHYETIRNICFERIAEQIAGDVSILDKIHNSKELKASEED